MIPRFHRYGFCIGTGYTGRKFRRNFGGPSWEEDVGGIEYREPIGRDDGPEWPV